MNRRQSLTELTNVKNEIGPGTVSWKAFFNPDEYRRRLLKKKMRVCEVNKTKRVKWCREAKKKTVDDYWKKLFLQMNVKLWLMANDVYMYGEKPVGMKPILYCFSAGRRLDLMISGCITYNGVGILCVVDWNINAQKYIQMIDNHQRLNVAAYFPSNDYLFQDDNAPIYRARSVTEFMEQENVLTMEWPAQSPDLNIIEKCWRKRKQEQCKRVQNLITANDL